MSKHASNSKSIIGGKSTLSYEEMESLAGCEYTSQRLVEEEGGRNEKRGEERVLRAQQEGGGEARQEQRKTGGGEYEPGPPCKGGARWSDPTEDLVKENWGAGVRAIAAWSSPPDSPAPLPTPKSRPRKSARRSRITRQRLFLSVPSPFHFRSPIPCAEGGRMCAERSNGPSASSTRETSTPMSRRIARHPHNTSIRIRAYPTQEIQGRSTKRTPVAPPRRCPCARVVRYILRNDGAAALIERLALFRLSVGGKRAEEMREERQGGDGDGGRTNEFALFP
ncbi:hypothetical protein B0H13DRAFT_2460575 [Mycena leptocephala]|nr:hypothetical protein B0H13DRAFT_2460575 [Mycena leptocephala]